MAKSAHQIIRESVRRVLREAAPAAKKPAATAAPGDKLKLAVFGDVKSGATTPFYDDVLGEWDKRQEGKYVFVFTPSPDRKTISVAVTALGGAQDQSYREDDVEFENPVERFTRKLVVGDPAKGVPSIISKLTPDMWADISKEYKYSLPGGVSFSGEMDLTKESRMLSERWMKIAGLLTEAPAAAVKMVKDYDAKVDKGFKSEAEMQAAKKTLATGLKSAGVVGEDKILDALQAGGVGGDGAVSFASELAAMQK